VYGHEYFLSVKSYTWRVSALNCCVSPAKHQHNEYLLSFHYYSSKERYISKVMNRLKKKKTMERKRKEKTKECQERKNDYQNIIAGYSCFRWSHL
jgi:hypothetical protein